MLGMGDKGEKGACIVEWDARTETNVKGNGMVF
jgi:hypothetical protein